MLPGQTPRDRTRDRTPVPQISDLGRQAVRHRWDPLATSPLEGGFIAESYPGAYGRHGGGGQR